MYIYTHMSVNIYVYMCVCMRVWYYWDLLRLFIQSCSRLAMVRWAIYMNVNVYIYDGFVGSSVEYMWHRCCKRAGGPTACAVNQYLGFGSLYEYVKLIHRAWSDIRRSPGAETLNPQPLNSGFRRTPNPHTDIMYCPAPARSPAVHWRQWASIYS